MKKIVRVVLLACVLAVGMTVGSMGLETVQADEVVEKIDGVTYKEIDGDMTVTACDEGITTAKIQEEINGKTVTSIGDNAFFKCSSLTEITVPTGVTSIGKYAFASCAGLKKITIPTSVTSIADGAFTYCTGLTEITIPVGVTFVGNSAFSGCSGLTEITLPSGVTSIDNMK